MINFERLNELAKKVSKDSLAHGFKSNQHQPTEITAMAAMEMAGVYDAWRNNRIAKSSDYSRAQSYVWKMSQSHNLKPKLFTDNYNQHARHTVQDKIADIAIFLLLAMGHFGIKLNDEDINYIKCVWIPEKCRFLCFSETIIRILIVPDFFYETKACKNRLYDAFTHLDEWTKHLTGDDLWFWVEEKIEYNKYRPYLHGRLNKDNI